MSFWNLSDGEDAKETGNSFETGGGNMEPIPDGSSVLASIDDAKWDEDREGFEYLSLRWTVAKPEQFANRKVFHKLWVTDDKPKQKDPEKTRDKAKRMLAAIDSNAGGKLARKNGKPTSDELALALMGKPMVIRLQVWDMEGKTGNWVASVSPKDHELKVGETKAAPRAAANRSGGGDDWGGGSSRSKSFAGAGFGNDLDEEVPF